MPVRVFPGLLEPLVLVGRVVQRQVDHDAHVALVGLGDEVLELVEGAELGEDRPVVGNVVTAVAQRGIEEGRNPQRIDAEPLQVVEFGDEAGQVSRPIRIAVNE